MKTKCYKIISICILSMFVIFSFFGLSGCTHQTLQGVIFYTGFKIEGVTTKEMSTIKQRLKDIESNISANIYNYPNSEINIVNQSKANIPVNVGLDFEHLFNVSKEMNECFNSFNPAIYPLIEKWKLNHEFVIDYSPNIEEIPSDDEIEQILSICSLDNFTINQKNITKSEDESKLDFGAIAKGFAVDQIFDMIKSNNKVVDIGGTIRSKKEINVGILHPRKKDQIFAEVKIKNQAIATSGDYYRFYYLKGDNTKRYHHIIDPSNGYPSGFYQDNPVVSVTVIGPKAEICDVLSTVFMIEDKNVIESSLKSKKFEEYSTVLIHEDGTYAIIGNKKFQVF